MNLTTSSKLYEVSNFMSILHPAYEISKISVNEVDWLPAVEDQTLEENVKMNLKDSQIE